MKQVRPKKNLGQHFLIDLGIAKRIADTVDAYPDIPVLEVGPGMGVMTQYLVDKPRDLKVVEIDRESVAYKTLLVQTSCACHWMMFLMVVSLFLQAITPTTFPHRYSLR